MLRIPPIKVAATKLLNKTKDSTVKAINYLGETKWMESLNKSSKIENSKIMTGVGVGSIVLKDGFGCYLYVKQSLNNKDIPDDKRKFVAALDLVNGGLMIGFQLLMYKTLSNKNFQKKMFDKLFGKYFTRDASKGYMARLNAKEGTQGIGGKIYQTVAKEINKDSTSLFGHFTSLVAAVIIGKRVLVPFIATPLADKAKAWMCRNDKPETTHSKTSNKYHTDKPTILKKTPANRDSNLIKAYVNQCNNLNETV